jgi:AcrR family transcriptional regulator
MTSMAEGPHHDLPRGPHSLSREQVAANQHQRLVSAMIDAIGERGYARTTVADVVGRAGVSRKAFYAHFANKRECFLAAYDAIMEEWTRRIQEAYRASSGWPDSAEAAIRALLEAAIENPGAARLGMVEIAAAGAPGVERRERAIAGYERFIREALELVLVDDAVLKAVVGGFTRALYRGVRSGEHEQLLELVPDLVRWTTAYYPPPEILLANLRARRSEGPPRRTWQLIGGRAPGTLSPHALSPRRRGLAHGEYKLSHSFVIHNQRERILDAVANLTAAKGYAALKVEDIVEEAAVSLQAFYEHFSDKEDAFLVAYELGHAKGLSIVERAYIAEPDWRNGVKAAIAALLRYLASEPSFAHLALVEALLATPRVADRAYAGVSSYAQMLIPGLEQATPNEGPPAIAIEAIAGGLFELCFHYAARGQIRALPEIAVVATYIALAPFVGAEEAARVAIEPA